MTLTSTFWEILGVNNNPLWCKSVLPVVGHFESKHRGLVEKNITSVTSKKSLNVYKSCPKRISLVKWKILTQLQKLPKMCWWFGQNNCFPGLWNVAQSIKKSPNLVTLNITTLMFCPVGRWQYPSRGLRSMSSVTRKKSPNIYKSWLKMISLEKWMILTPSQKLLKNVGDLDKLTVAKGFKKLFKVQ